MIFAAAGWLKLRIPVPAPAAALAYVRSLLSIEGLSRTGRRGLRFRFVPDHGSSLDDEISDHLKDTKSATGSCSQSTRSTQARQVCPAGPRPSMVNNIAHTTNADITIIPEGIC